MKSFRGRSKKRDPFERVTYAPHLISGDWNGHFKMVQILFLTQQAAGCTMKLKARDQSVEMILHQDTSKQV